MSITLILFLMATQPQPANLNAVPVLADPLITNSTGVDGLGEARDRSTTDLKVVATSDGGIRDSRGGVHPYPGYSPADVFAAVVEQDEAKQNADKPWTEPTPLPGNSMAERLKEKR